ncbi:sigma-70 family RNA polymerase sigma factor [Paenibacillus hunanensis]|uniref:sigma-70 family RNA polymerase sigma factor n=1 Tax=Paenibacillus hunanensis TaxID=539262 RepID=UPI002A69F9E8|nr:sigma-70 family RNA polymerase sigma factor [Paenibacillus hunanensis]WPP43132.1 sigma-70 family RNA polymerase sigma factor [Paenibacillus hunanensis]
MIGRKKSKAKETQFTEQMTSIRGKLYRLAYCYVKNEQEALDIVSDATYKGYLAFMKADTVTYFDSWMSRIVINTAIDYMYRSKPMLVLEDFTQGLEAPVENVSIEAKMDLYNALDRLRPEEKTYIILKYFVSLSFREMAEVLAVPENTVKSRFYRIMQQLKAYLIEGEVDSI